MKQAVRPIRVLLVDDSATVRAVLRRLLARAGDLEVVGEAADGAQAVEQTVRLAPDVVLMDVEMPVMDGFTATSRIMAVRPTPILVITSRANREGVRTAFEAVRNGALEVLPKPEDTAGWEQLAQSLPLAVRSAAQARVARFTPEERGDREVERRGRAHRPAGRAPGATAGETTAPAIPAVRVVAVGASTGGPQAVHAFLQALPPKPPAPVLVVQHIAAGFEEGFSEWLAGAVKRDVRVAHDGEAVVPGAVRVAPAGAHLLMEANGVLRLDTATPPRGGHRPSVDELFLSCAASYPNHTAGVLLSGMGSDGAEGLLALRRAGSLTMIQDEASSVVFGMPRAALERGAAAIVLPPRELGLLLRRHWQETSA